MKKVLAVVLAVALVSIGAMSVNAQPNVQVYFNENLSETQANCAGIGAPVTLYVVVNNFNNWLSAIEYSISYPPSLTYIADNSPAPLNIGNTLTGVASSFPLPVNAFQPAVVMEVLALWNCDVCAGHENDPVVVLPHPVTTFLRATTWPDNLIVDLVGMTSLVCATVPVEETTWGGVKALYGE